jgi:hypothetical protein
LSSASTISEASRAASVPFLAHGDADVGALERRRVVDAVAGHRDTCLGLQRLHEAQLVLGAGAREDVDVACACPRRLVVVEVLEFGTPVRRRVGLRGRARAAMAARSRVVAGDHLDRMPALAAARDRLDRLLARRVDQAEKAEQLEPVLGVGARQLPVARARRALRATASTRWPAPGDLGGRCCQ